MKLLNFYLNGEKKLGVKTDRGILNATDATGVTPDAFIDDAASRDKVARWLDADGKTAEALDEGSLKTAPCVAHSTKIVGVGLNYCEYMINQKCAKPEFPHLFPKYPEAVRGQGDPVILPFNSDQVDFEGELAVVIGKKARLVDEEHALDYVLGYTNANDMSSRDFQNATTSWVPGKCCDGFAPIGPYLVTADEVKDPNNLQVKAWVNGELRQNFNTSDMIRNVKFLISGITKFFTLNPGDIILTGTSIGIIMCDPEDKRVWLKDGDLLEVEIEGFGRLVNPVRKEVL
jgi:2-keto-4-pentenoate hydratase/2-oxohepta-3-ene-1,7-dioic acid hydratase in catechol pathway